uniref:PABC domain-containing protein n=1 Tax=Alexandrium catenella TaxID=2925 RepID=A0A7S1S448_ALECA|mmetsp:Transcript_85493/g.227114  ORF Transcript_85493/g.227114 Transcript_85493/m.227114 type:complete len:387 (-) Transcript_85493:75-1235(-)
MNVYPGMMPGGLSPDSYVDKQLRPLDAENYSAAGLLLYRRAGGERLELMFVREKPWNSFTQAYDPVALNAFGGKRVPRQERSAETTAVRCFLESVGQVDGAPDTEMLYRLLRSSFVLWYATGKFVMLVAEVPEESMTDLPEKFTALKEQQGPGEEYKMLPSGVKKYVKQIEALEWVPAAKLLSAPQPEVTDLLFNMLQIGAFREFLEGKLDPVTAWPDTGAPSPPVFNWGDGGKDGKSKGKDKGKGGGKSKGGKDGGKGWKGGYGKGGGGNMMYGGKGMGMDANKGMNMCGGKGMGMYPGKGMPMGPMVYSSYDQNSAEMQRQMYGEQLYLLVQPMAPSPYLAQKITGMLLELPQNELLMNLTNQEELRRRVMEALEVLKEDGVVS